MSSEPKQVTLSKPVTLVLTPAQVDVILRGMESLPFGTVRPVYAEIEKQILEQINAGS